LFVSTLARLEFSDIQIAVVASPVVLYVTTLASLKLRVVEVAVVAAPASLDIAALAGLELGDKPPVLFIVASTTAFHVVAVGVADVASGAGPVVLNVVALGTGLELGDVPLAIFAGPVVLDVVALGTGLELGDAPVFVPAEPVVLNVAALAGLEGSHFKVAVFAEPTHYIIL
jgi:hypothetical protein